ncbi:MAG: apolipoprotein N-acyltransferase [Alphaproteobacteria bacterium]
MKRNLHNSLQNTLKILNWINRHPYLSSFINGLMGGAIFSGSIFDFIFSSVAIVWFLKNNETHQNPLLCTFLFLWAFFMMPLYWIPSALFVEIESFWWLVPFCFAGIPAALAAIYTVVSFLVPWRRRSPVLKLFLFAVFWVVAEFVSSFIFTGFPWALIGYSWDSLPMLQFASVGSVYGVSFFSILVLGAPYLWLQNYRSPWPWVILALWGGIYSWGYYRLEKNPTQFTGVSVRLVQPNIPQVFKWEYGLQESNLRKILNLVERPAAQPIQVVIWPEAAFGFDLEKDSHFCFKVAASLPSGSTLVTGAMRYAGRQGFNSVFALSSGGDILATYDKHHLVPFGEYIPLRRYLEMVFPKNHLRIITAGLGDFAEGPGPRTLAINNIPPFSPLICYEVVFPGQVVDPTHKPDWLLSVTNDAWFGDTAGPRQHLKIAQVRAIEESIPLIRVANTGISAIIDPCGRLIKTLPLNTTGVLDGYLPRGLS